MIHYSTLKSRLNRVRKTTKPRISTRKDYIVRFKFQTEREALAMRKIFVPGLNYETTEETLRSHFSKYGTIEELVIVRDPRSNVRSGL